MILVRGVDDGIDGDNRRPTFGMVRLIPDPDHPGAMIEGDERRYPNNQIGVTLFHKDEARFEELLQSKMKLISKLLMTMQDDVRAKVETWAGFRDARDRGDLLSVWRITEQVVQGTGSISIFSLTTKLYRLRQGDPVDWPRYSKEWLQTVTDLRRAGNAEQVLLAMLTTHLVFSVNQDQFRDKLTPIYGSNVWPEYDVIMEQLNTYALNMERIADIDRDASTEGRIQAYAMNAGRNFGRSGGADQSTKGESKGCWNCGSGMHIRVNCPSPPAVCNRCGGRGHIATYCGRVGGGGNGRDDDGRKSAAVAAGRSTKTVTFAGGRTNNGGGGASAMMRQQPTARTKTQVNKRSDADKRKTLRAAIGLLADQLDDVEDDERDDDDADDYYDDDDDNDDVECNIIDIVDDNGLDDLGGLDEAIPSTENRDVTVWTVDAGTVTAAALPSLTSIHFILDTGCKKMNICSHVSLLTNLRRTNARVIGVEGRAITATSMGILPIAGPTLCLPRNDVNLLSVPLLLDTYNGCLKCDSKVMEIFDGDGALVVRATRPSADTFWTCSAQHLQEMATSRFNRTHTAVTVCPSRTVPPVIKAFPTTATTPLPLPSSLIRPQTPSAPQAPPPRFFSAEERTRALGAWKLCALWGHPGHEKVAEDLDNGCRPDLPFTSQDVRNGVLIHGPCVACLEGKMRAPPKPPSQSPSASTVGEHLHGDLIPLRGRSLGGHTVANAVVDEKTSFISVVPMVNKSTRCNAESFEQIILFYNQHGHTVRRVTTDNEETFRALQPYLAGRGIILSHTPADLHENRIERKIQALKARRRAILAQLPYELPLVLEAESYVYAAWSMNTTSTKTSAPSTPYHLVTGRKPFSPEFYFGQTGLFQTRRKDSPDMRAEWGIFLGYGDGPGSLRAYIPMRNGVYSRRYFVPHPGYPAEWNLVPRVRAPNTPIPTQPFSIQPPAPHPLNTTPVVLPPPTLEDFRHVDQTPALPLPTPPLLPSPALPLTDTVTSPVPATTSVPAARQQSPAQEGADEEGAVNAPPTDKGGRGTGDRSTTQQGATTRAKQTRDDASSSRGGNDKPPSSRDRQPDDDGLTPRRQLPARAAALRNQGWITGRYSSMYLLDQADADKNKAEDTWYFKSRNRILTLSAFHISFNEAMNMDGKKDLMRAAAFAEVNSLLRNKVAKPINPKSLTAKQRAQAIPAHMFFKVKYKADGQLDKIKARLVANGNRQHKQTIGETFSPTVNPMTILIVLAVALNLGMMFISLHDVVGAFLIPRVIGKLIVLILPPKLATLWVDAVPEHAQYLTETGHLYLTLEKYLYGLAESNRQFNLFLDDKLQQEGFTRSKADPCLYVRETDDGLHFVAVHVDDILSCAPSLRVQQEFERALKGHFDITTQTGESLSYLGMNISVDKMSRTLRLDQIGFLRSILDKFNCNGDTMSKFPPTPSTADILLPIEDQRDLTLLTPPEIKKFLSIVMSLMYLARFTRPDILFSVTVLATRCSRPTATDMTHAYRVLRYLAGTPNHGLFLDGKATLAPQIYADASHCTHPTGHGHAGIVITLGSAPVLCKSFKLKAVTRSSSESELYALEEATTYAVWLLLLLDELRLPCTVPIPVFQDNLSTIIMASKENMSFKRSKHLLTREGFVREKILSGDIVLLPKRTEEMIADFLTKPVNKVILYSCLRALHLVSTE